MASARYFTHAQADPHEAQILDHAVWNLKGSLVARQIHSFTKESSGKSK
jgi:hypothetical protein